MRNHLINEKTLPLPLIKISKQIPDFLFLGRFDFTVQFNSGFGIGEKVMIMEVNGCGAEPAHILSNPALRCMKALTY
jgi:hypothetical protein